MLAVAVGEGGNTKAELLDHVAHGRSLTLTRSYDVLFCFVLKRRILILEHNFLNEIVKKTKLQISAELLPD